MSVSKKWGRWFYHFTYVGIIVGIGLSLLVTGYDLIEQTLALAQGGGRYFYIFILVGAYVATGVLSGIIALTRLLTVRKALAAIPKRYMPIKKIDIPPPVHKLISTEITRSAIIRHSTLPTPSHKGLAPSTQPHFPSTSYTPIILHSAILMMSKASRFRRSLIPRKNETLRKYLLRARDVDLWSDDTAKEGVIIYLDTYEGVRFGGVELSEREFTDSMKLVYYLLSTMKPPPGGVGSDLDDASILSSESSGSLLSDSDSPFYSDGDDGSRQPSIRGIQSGGEKEDAYILSQMQSYFSDERRSGDSASVRSMIDHGSVLEEAIDREERQRRMRGGRLGEREGSVIYYGDD